MVVLIGNISLSYTTNFLVPSWDVIAGTTAAAAAFGAALGLLASPKRRPRP
jgi:hypothetical protein